MDTRTIYPASEIIFDNLEFADTLRLQTLNNTYEFTVTNPAQRQGFLAGGVFGKISVPAVLCHPDQLRTGAQVRFHIESTVDYIYLTTTVINYLEVVKNNKISLERLRPTAKLDRQPVEYIH